MTPSAGGGAPARRLPWTFLPAPPAAGMELRRLPGNPVLTPATADGLGPNVNGPSLVAAPDWVADPPGRYYLFFADHGGEAIRLATADDLTGPWRLQSPPLALPAAGEGFDDHVASPDVHVDADRERVRMYYHGCCDRREGPTGSMKQYTRVAVSTDGHSFVAREEPLGRFYFRVFEYGGYYYALAKENRGDDESESGQRVYRSADPLSGFRPGPLLFCDGARHTAVRRRGDTLDVFYSRIGDAPERILHATVDLSAPWREWTATDPRTVLEPEHVWEGADEPVVPSESGSAGGRVNGLRDPAVFEEGGDSYLLYTVAGERGIAVAEILD